MRRPIGIFVCVVVGLGCSTCPRPSSPTPAPAEPVAWSEIATDYGEIAIPVGWHVRVRRSVDVVFDLYSGDRDLGVFAWPVVRADFDASLDDAVRRYLKGIGSPSLELVAQPEGWKYGEVAVAPGRIYAACAVEYQAEQPAAFLVATATIYQVDEAPRSVSKKLYDEAGGREMLCGIAASARRLDILFPRH